MSECKQSVLLEYVRDKKGNKCGVVVALGRDKIGWSSYNTNKETKEFSKDFGVLVALGRACVSKQRDKKAKKVKDMLSNGVLTSGEANVLQLARPQIPKHVKPIYEKMVSRANRYFKIGSPIRGDGKKS